MPSGSLRFPKIGVVQMSGSTAISDVAVCVCGVITIHLSCEAAAAPRVAATVEPWRPWDAAAVEEAEVALALVLVMSESTVRVCKLSVTAQTQCPHSECV